MKTINSLNDIDISPDQIVIDCGANVGDVTNYFQSRGATVYCFEPNTYAFSILQNRFLHNNKVHCFQKGVSDKDEYAKLYLHKETDLDPVKYSTGSSLVEDKNNIDKNKFLVVELIDLVSFIKGFQKEVQVLKIDVEGAECKIINSLIDNNLHKKIKHILVETHEKKIPSIREEVSLLRKRIESENIVNINLNWI